MQISGRGEVSFRKLKPLDHSARRVGDRHWFVERDFKRRPASNDEVFIRWFSHKECTSRRLKQSSYSRSHFTFEETCWARIFQSTDLKCKILRTKIRSVVTNVEYIEYLQDPVNIPGLMVNICKYNQNYCREDLYRQKSQTILIAFVKV